LNSISCECKNKWKKSLHQYRENLLDRTVEIYKIASINILNKDLEEAFIINMRKEYVDEFQQS
jgi:hypothetical protein